MFYYALCFFVYCPLPLILKCMQCSSYCFVNWLSIRPSIPFPVPAATGQEAGYTPDRQSVCDRASTERHILLQIQTYRQSPANLTALTACVGIMGGSGTRRREPTKTQGKHAKSTQKGLIQMVVLNPGSFWCEASVLTISTVNFSPLFIGGFYLIISKMTRSFTYSTVFVLWISNQRTSPACAKKKKKTHT